MSQMNQITDRIKNIFKCSSLQVKPDVSLYEIYFVGDFHLQPPAGNVLFICSLSFACTQLVHNFFFLLQSSKSSCFFFLLYFPLTWIISLLKECCFAASLASKSLNPSSLLTEIAGVRFGKIGTLST